ncbi:MAG: hypothetical protein OEY86_02265 [Nitrospira sp.]|nr:hypothetical protein [Nitrospira sp.]
MPIDPQLLEQVLRTPESRDVTESPIVRVVILADAANASDLVPALNESGTVEANNARRILALFEPAAVPHLLAALGPAGLNARMEGLEALWALLVGEEKGTVRETLTVAKPSLDVLLEDTRPLPDEMPEYIERDFRGRICDLAYIVVQQLLDPEVEQSMFRSLDDRGRDAEIRRLKNMGFGLRIV